MGGQSFIKKRKYCTEKTGGSTCAGVHHNFLQGSGVAFCHKVRVVAQQSTVTEYGTNVAGDDIDSPSVMT